MDSPIQAYRLEQDWQRDWEKGEKSRGRGDRSAFKGIANHISGSLLGHGFQLFENGGTPLFVRYFNDLREEILLVPAPRMLNRRGMPFTAKVYLSSPLIGKIRSRFWRPACRAPQVIAAGSIGALEIHPVHYIFEAAGELECASWVSHLISKNVLPWLNVFHSPDQLRNRIYDDELPLISESTAVELLLAQFDPFEARRYLRYRELNLSELGVHVDEIEGYDLASSRINPIRTYYNLETPKKS